VTDEQLARILRGAWKPSDAWGAVRGNTKSSLSRPYNLEAIDERLKSEPTFGRCEARTIGRTGGVEAARHAPPERRMLAMDLVVRVATPTKRARIRAHKIRKNRDHCRSKAHRLHTPGLP